MKTIAQAQTEQPKRNEQPTERQKAAALEEHATATSGHVIWVEDDYGAYGLFSAEPLTADPEFPSITDASHAFGARLHSAAHRLGGRVVAVHSYDHTDGYVITPESVFVYVASFGEVYGKIRQPGIGSYSVHNKPGQP